MQRSLLHTLPLMLIALLSMSCNSQSEPEPLTETAGEETEPLPSGSVENLASHYEPQTLYVLANDYAVGNQVEADQEVAERLWRVACDKGHAYACSNYGSRQIAKGNFDEARVYLELAANGGVLDAIRNLIELHDNNQWPGSSSEESVRWFNVVQAIETPDQAASDAPAP